MRSAVVGSAAVQDALDDDRPRGDVELNDHAPIADPKTGLPAALQPSQVGASRLVGEPPDRAEHPLLDLRIKSFEILVGAPFELDDPRLSAVTNRRACA
jgi:hypothetical protein